MVEEAPAGWYADPYGRYEHRHWDGGRWTEHVSTGGRSAVDVVAAPAEDRGAAAQAAGWYADPGGSGGHRYWDGEQWTGQLAWRAPEGALADGVAVAPSSGAPTKRGVARQARRAGAPASGGQSGGGTLFTEQVLVFNQKARVLRSTSEYAIFRKDGVQLGTIEEVRLDLGAKLGARLNGVSERSREHRFQVVDPEGRLLLKMARSETGWFANKGQLRVEGPRGPIGLIRQQSTGLVGEFVEAAGYLGVMGAPKLARHAIGGVKGLAAGVVASSAKAPAMAAVGSVDDVGRARFSLEAGNRQLGSIRTRGGQEKDFRILDADGTAVGRITRTWEGFAKQFTKADHYVLILDRPLDDPFRSLVIAAALAIDIELRE